MRRLPQLLMKRIAQYCLIYGCVASAGALLWYGASILGYVAWPEGPWVVVSVFIVHGLVMVITFHRDPSRRLWDPVIRITPQRVCAAKVILALAAANFLFCTMLAQWEKGSLSLRTLTMAFSSFALLNASYVAIHWALRPENLFPNQLLALISNPIGYVFFRRPRRRKDTSRRSLPNDANRHT